MLQDLTNNHELPLFIYSFIFKLHDCSAEGTRLPEQVAVPFEIDRAAVIISVSEYSGMIVELVCEENPAARPKAVSDTRNTVSAKKTVPFLQCSFFIETTLLSDGLTSALIH